MLLLSLYLTLDLYSVVSASSQTRQTSFGRILYGIDCFIEQPLQFCFLV